MIKSFIVASLFAQIAVGSPTHTPSLLEATFGPLSENLCGPNALQACLRMRNHDVGRADLMRYIQHNGKETSFRQLDHAASSVGVRTVAVRWKKSPFFITSAPAILRLKVNGAPHFVAAVGWKDGKIATIDFPDAWLISPERLKAEYEWNGDALHIVDNWMTLSALYVVIYAKYLLLVIMLIAAVWYVAKVRRRGLRQRRVIDVVSAASSAVLVTLLMLPMGCTPANNTVADVELAEIDPHELFVGREKGDEGVQAFPKELQVKNVSTGTIKILSVTASCGCTALGAPSSTSLVPGEVAAINVNVEPPQFGAKRSEITVVVADELEQRQLIRSAIMMRGLPIEPPSLRSVPSDLMMRVDPDGSSQVEIKLTTYEQDSSEYLLVGALCDSELVEIENGNVVEKPSTQEGVVEREYHYRFSLRDGGKTLDRSETCRIRFLDDSGEALATTRLQIVPWRPIDIVPTTVEVANDVPLKKELRVLLKESRYSVEHILAESSAPWVAIKEVSNGRIGAVAGVVKLEISRRSHDDSMDATVRVTVKFRSGESLTRDVMVVAREVTAQ